MFKFLHWSDPHGKGDLTVQTDQLAQMLSVDENICTGDLVPDYYEQGISTLDLNGVLAVTGNHDVILESGTDPSGYQWDKQPTAAQQYQRYFAPYKDANGIVIESDRTYWYKRKTYDGLDICIIGLDSQARGDLKTYQDRWLQTMLSDALKTKTRVLIASHYPNSRLKCLENSWLDRPYYPNLETDTYASERDWYPAIISTYDIVNSYADQGLEVIAWVTGHEHADCLFEGGNVKKYPMTTIAATIPDRYSDLYRGGYGTVDAICANYCEYRPEERVLRMYRLGAGSSKGGSERVFAIWDYDKSKWVTVLDRVEGW